MGDKPVFRVGVAGLDTRDLRLIEIVFRHSHYNKYAFSLVDARARGGYDLLIANAAAPAGQQAIGAARASPERKPVIAALARGAAACDGHAISIDRLTLQLLPILNRVVELELKPEPELQPATQPPAAAVPDGSAHAVRLAATGAAGEPAMAGPVQAGSVEVEPAGSGSAQTAPTEPSPIEPAPIEPAPLEPALSRSAEVALPSMDRVAPPPCESTEVERPLSLESGGPLEPVELHETRERLEHQTGGQPPVHIDAHPADYIDAHPADEADAYRVDKVDERQAAESDEDGMGAADAQLPDQSDEFLAGGAAATLNEHEADAGQDGSPHGAGVDLPHLPASGPGSRLRVLVVDDSPTVRRQLTIALERLGLACETVDSAARALERLAHEHFDLALVDVVMPDADGYKLTRDIKRDKRLRQMPVIILTSRSSPFDLARGALSGCDAYLSKPVPFRALEAAVVRQLRRSLALDDLSRVMASPDAADAQDQSPRPESRLARLFRR